MVVIANEQLGAATKEVARLTAIGALIFAALMLFTGWFH